MATILMWEDYPKFCRNPILNHKNEATEYTCLGAVTKAKKGDNLSPWVQDKLQ